MVVFRFHKLIKDIRQFKLYLYSLEKNVADAAFEATSKTSEKTLGKLVILT